MPRSDVPPAIAMLVEAPVPRDEFLARADRPPAQDEVAEVAALVRWFTRRYPTVRERLAYVRRTYRRWSRRLG